MQNENILEVKKLMVDVITPSGMIRPVRNVNFEVKKNHILGIVGESGSGKSMTIKSIMRLHNERKVDVGGEIIYMGKSILSMDSREMMQLRGQEISMIFQDPMVALNPIKKVGKQLTEMIRNKQKISKSEARQRVMEVFEKVEITPAGQRMEQYPFEMSGGMLQRVIIAMSILCGTRLLLADEPTTALDVTTQGQVLKLIRRLRDSNEMSVIVVTHNLGVVAEICDDVAVMYAGEIVEYGDVRTIFDQPKHPYTVALMKSRPGVGERGARMTTIPGVPPSLYALADGCPFAPRCTMASEECFVHHPTSTASEDGHQVMCCRMGKGA